MTRHKSRRVTPQISESSDFWVTTLLSVIVGAVFSTGNAAWAQTSSAKIHSETQIQRPQLSTNIVAAHAKLAQAKRLIVDAFPEDRDNAEALIIEATRIAPEIPEPFAELARFTLWQIANGMKDTLELHKASQLATHVRDLAPERPLGDYLIAEILSALGQQQQAMKLFTQASAKYSEHLDTKVFEARFYSESNPRRALESAQVALAAGHSMDDLSPAIALALTQLSKGHSAGDALLKFAEIYPDRWLLHRAGAAYAEEHQPQKAREAYLKAIALGNGMESRLQLGILEYTALHEPQKALQHFAELDKLLSKRDNSHSDGQALVASHAALAALTLHDDLHASSFGNKALVLGATNGNVVGAVVEEFKRRNKADLLWPGLVAVAKDNPFLDYAHVSLAVIALDKKDYATAIEYFGNALALAPERDDLFSARGHAAYLALNYDSALRDFESALKIHPEQSSYHYNKSCMLALLGRKDEAMASLKTALLMNRDLRDVASRDVDLKNLRVDQSYQNQLAKLGVIPKLPGMKRDLDEKDSDESALAVDYSNTNSNAGSSDESLE